MRLSLERSSTLHMNYEIFRFFNQFAGKFDSFDDLMEFCAQGIVWIQLAIMAIFWISAKARYQKTVFYAGLSSAVSLFLAAFLISPAVNHPRPFATHDVNQLIPHVADASFPSDHATLAFAIAFSVWFAHRRLGAAMLGLAILTGIARIYVGVHYPADIAGAIALSAIVSFVIYRTNGKLDPIPSGLIRLYGKLAEKIKFLPRSEK